MRNSLHPDPGSLTGFGIASRMRLGTKQVGRVALMIGKHRAFKAATVVVIIMSAAVIADGGAAFAGRQSAALATAKTTIGQFVGALGANEVKVLGKIVVHDPDMVAFGTDQAERWVGYGQLMKALHTQLAAFRTTDVSVRDEVVHLTPLKDGAYFSEVWNWKLRSQGKDMVLKDVRVTGVLVRRHGRWLVAQFHISMPVGGQAVPY